MNIQLVVTRILIGLTVTAPMVFGPAAHAARPENVVLSVEHARVVEGDAGTVEIAFRIVADRPPRRPISFDYETGTTSFESATPGSDYISISGSSSMAVGQTLAVITTRVNGDVLDEGTQFTESEWLGLRLYNLTGATHWTGGNEVLGSGEIVDDDDPPSISIADTSVVEGDAGTTNAVVTLSLSAPSGREVAVTLITSDAEGQAVSGWDFPPTYGSAKFPKEQTSLQFTLPVYGDSTGERDEKFWLDLSVARETVADGRAEITIVNDDGALPAAIPMRLLVREPAFTEGYPVKFLVALDRPASNSASVGYRTEDGTATSPIVGFGTPDYFADAGTLTFPSGSAWRSVSVETLNDGFCEDYVTEYFYFEIFGPIGATIDGPARVRGDIPDDGNGCGF